MNIEEIGNKIDDIEVVITNKIIELFSAGLYSSPNKAFEELICNSYDAFASKVSVYAPDDTTVSDAYIWVCDNGEGLNKEELKKLWRIGESSKRSQERENKRLQIGQFGIGKLSTYILARKLTYISKKEEVNDGNSVIKYILATMDYNLINNDSSIKIDEREISEEELKNFLNNYINKDYLNFNLFGDNCEKSWTISIMTDLKPKAKEIKHGRLKWLLSTALPLNPGFNLVFNGQEIESSKINISVLKEWKIAKDDDIIGKIEGATSREENGEYYLDLPNLKGVRGSFILYEKSLLESSKSSQYGRSHGIFLSIRGRLINLDDPLLGMDAFSHGAFNRVRILIDADELDNNLTSTREAVKESEPLNQLKEYIKKKFNNEIKSFYFDYQNNQTEKKSISERMAAVSYFTTKEPLYNFIKRFDNEKVKTPFIIKLPTQSEELLSHYEKDLESEEQMIKEIDWQNIGINNPISQLDLNNRKLTINKLHPFVANYIDNNEDNYSVENIAICEALTEAYLYQEIDEECLINNIMIFRDKSLRQLVYSSDNVELSAVAMRLKESLTNSKDLENATALALSKLGFNVVKIGGNGQPDGKAEALLGFDSKKNNRSYSLTYDAKSTSKDKIKAVTSHLSGLVRHKNDYKAEYCMEVAINYEGSDDPESAISKEADQEKVTIFTVKDLIKLIFLIVPKQIGLDKLEELFKTCYKPLDVSRWINDIENTKIEIPPYSEIIDIIYEFQSNDTEPPVVQTIRNELNKKLDKKYDTEDLKYWLDILVKIAPNFIDVKENMSVALSNKPEIIKKRLRLLVGNVNGYEDLYEELFKE